MKKIAAAICCFFGAWILLGAWSPMRTVLLAFGGFQITLALLAAVALAWAVVASMGK